MRGIRTRGVGDKFVIINTETNKTVIDLLILDPRNDPEAIKIVKMCDGLEDWHRELISEYKKMQTEKVWIDKEK